MPPIRCKPKGNAPLCACGCGEITAWSGPKNRWAAYVNGHQNRGRVSPLQKERPAAPLCACGCGQPVKTWRYRRGWAKYLNGHAPRQPHTPESIEKMRLAAKSRAHKVAQANREREWSAESRQKARQAKLEAHPQWTGNGHAEYWQKTSLTRYAIDKIKARIRKRDGYSCVTCGKPPPKTKSHIVHHIDSDLGNNGDMNLATMCISCHNKLELHDSADVRTKLHSYMATLTHNI